MAMEKVQIQKMSKTYENGDGVKAIDLTIHEGEILTLLGPSGCGKSTILRCLGGFQPIDEGRIVIDGEDVTTTPPEKRPTSMVFQSYNLWNHMTVYENLAFGLKLRKLPKGKIKEQISDMLTLLGLPDVAKKFPNQLSGGQQQRIAIGRSLLLDPSVLLLDEPYSALDAKIRQQMREELKRIQKETGVTVVFVTHDQEEAMALSNRIVVMEQGKIAQIGTPSEIYDAPKSRYIASFIGEMNFFKENNGLEIAFRPEDALLSATSGTYQGQIKQLMPVGHYSVATILYQRKLLKIYLAKGDSNKFEEEQQVYFTIQKSITYQEEKVG